MPNTADENHAQPSPQSGGTTATQAGQVKPSGDSTPTGKPNTADDQGTQLNLQVTKVLQQQLVKLEIKNQVVKQVILRTH